MIKKTDEIDLKRDNADSSCGEPGANNPAGADDSGWASDQKKRSYYYDDAHGYEIYDPEKDDEEDEN